MDKKEPSPDITGQQAFMIFIACLMGLMIIRNVFFHSTQEVKVMNANMLDVVEEENPLPCVAPIITEPATSLENAEFVKTEEEKRAEEEAKKKAEEAKKIVEKPATKSYGKQEVFNIIYSAADKYGVERKLMYCLAKGESSFNPINKHGQWTWVDINKDGKTDKKIWTVDRGLYQWNSFHKSYVSNSCAYDAKCAAEQAAKEIKQGKIKQWCAVGDSAFAACYGRTLPNVCDK